MECLGQKARSACSASAKTPGGTGCRNGNVLAAADAVAAGGGGDEAVPGEAAPGGEATPAVHTQTDSKWP